MISPISLKSLIALVGAITCAGAAQAATYTTQITGTSSGVNFSVSRIEIVWSTSVSEGNAVTVNDLTDWTISGFDGATLIYSDVVISSGTVQPLSGINRTLADIAFDAVSGVSVGGFDNDFLQNQLNSATGGVTANFYSSGSGSGGVVNVAKYDGNGDLIEDVTFSVTGQSTTSAIPEPSTSAALAALAALGLVAARRRARA